MFKTTDINLCIFLKCKGFNEIIELDETGFASFVFRDTVAKHFDEFLKGEAQASVRQVITKYRHVMQDIRNLRAIMYKKQQEEKEEGVIVGDANNDNR